MANSGQMKERQFFSSEFCPNLVVDRTVQKRQEAGSQSGPRTLVTTARQNTAHNAAAPTGFIFYEGNVSGVYHSEFHLECFLNSNLSPELKFELRQQSGCRITN